MYSSSSSSSQHSAPPNNPTNNNLTRYGSAPSSFLSSVAESVSGLGLGLHQQHHNHQHQQQQQHQQFFSGPGDSLSMNVTESTHPKMSSGPESRNTLTLLQDSYGMNSSPVKGAAAASTTASNLIRHSSSPPGFLNHLTSEIGYCNSKGMENYNNQGGTLSGHNLSRLGSQMSFTKQDHHSLSQIPELNQCNMLEGISSHDNHHHHKRASTSSQPRLSSGFSLSSWEDTNDGFSFSGPSNKRNKNVNDDFLNGLVSMESQQEIAFEMTSMDRLMQVPHDSVPCKIRAKRGFATHPRSIAERERRTRISGKLKKLQDLVPNMDKQTSYADMLDLAVQHIKGLQNEVEKLKGEVDRCTCGCKENMQH
ncbi:transcription factor bHLH128-like [Silene latifolia]|uniref:transcription factor bHLH128-like n=1 Tax=Silene latifolia TaxID=37657 RepID=UPI003D76D50F